MKSFYTDTMNEICTDFEVLTLEGNTLVFKCRVDNLVCSVETMLGEDIENIVAIALGFRMYANGEEDWSVYTGLYYADGKMEIVGCNEDRYVEKEAYINITILDGFGN